MITLIEALNFRCLRYLRQPLDPFHVLVGPNASGKTTFLDVVAFLGRLVEDGPEAALAERTANFQDLVWGRAGDRFELAVEAVIPEDMRAICEDGAPYNRVRYEIACGIDAETQKVGILAENVLLHRSATGFARHTGQFPIKPQVPTTVLTTAPARAAEDRRPVIIKIPKARGDNFYPEPRSLVIRGDWITKTRIKLGPHRSALGNMPADERDFPIATWLRDLLVGGVQSIALDSARLRKASAPGQGRLFRPDGANLPWVVADLQKKDPARFDQWIAHVRTALPDLETIRTVEREDDRHRYLMLRYAGGLEVPSWVASDGTLRMLALTLLAYLPDFAGVYLIEEPENGIHPAAIETVFQSLSSVYGAQILLATHSPVILSLTRAEDVLCFAKSADGATDVVRGSEHPALRDWKGTPNLGLLFGSGILGPA